MTEKNKRWVLAKRPEGMPQDDCWNLIETEIPEIEEGSILIKVLYLSIDPYMRGRMNDAKSYADPIQIGEIMTGESVGVVVIHDAGQASAFELLLRALNRAAQGGDVGDPWGGPSIMS